MQFKELSEIFEKLEGVSSQNEMIKILSDVFKKADEEEIDKICYYALGEIAASYEEVNLGMGEKVVQQSLSLASDIDLDKIKDITDEVGDLGEVAAEFASKSPNDLKRYFEAKDNLSVEDVHFGLKKIAETSGSGSSDVKTKTLAAMLMEAGPLERKYLVRLVMRNMSLGLGEITVLDALAVAFLGSKNRRTPMEEAYNIHPDIGFIAKGLKINGLQSIENISITLNIPIKPMLAQRVGKFSDIQKKINSTLIAAEEKYDGERIQAHKDGPKVALFSRRLSNVTLQYPEIVENVKNHIKTDKAILDGETVAYNFQNDEFYPFQKLMQRRRKYNVKEYMKKIPVRYMLFDVLYRDGKSLMENSYPERRENLEEILETHENELMKITGRIVSDNLDEIDDFFQECLDRNLEGVVCKSCSKTSYYKAGARKWSWIKWKKEYASELTDTLDLVVIGAFSGRGRRRGTYGSLLCAAYNEDKDVFETVCKLGAGFSDAELKNLPEKFRKLHMDKKPARAEVSNTINPSQYFKPQIVVEVLGAELTKSPIHTCGRDIIGKGLSLRFPRFIRWRTEKSVEDITTVREIVDMYTG